MIWDRFGKKSARKAGLSHRSYFKILALASPSLRLINPFEVCDITNIDPIILFWMTWKIWHRLLPAKVATKYSIGSREKSYHSEFLGLESFFSEIYYMKIL